MIDRNPNKRGANSLPLCRRGHHGIHDEGVNVTIPRNIHETDERAVVVGTHPSKTVLDHLCYPIVLYNLVAERLRMKCVQR